MGADGTPVRIASVGLTGMNVVGGRLELAGPFDGINGHVAAMRALGFNCVRVDWIDKTLDDAGAMAQLDQFVAACGKAGLKVIFDNHNNEATPADWENAAQQKNGLWFDTGPGTDGTDGAGNEGTVSAAQFKADWVAFARHWAGDATVIGFDLRNEPCAHYKKSPPVWGGGGPTDIHAMYQDVGNAILAVNPQALIICEAVINYQTGAYEGDLSAARGLPVVLRDPARLVYSVHEYPREIGGYKGPQSGPGYIERMNRTWGWLVQENVAPVWIGEMGASMASADSREWGDTLLAYMNGQAPGGLTLAAGQQGVGGDWWAWGCLTGQNPNGCVGEDGKVRPAQAPFIDRMLFRPRLEVLRGQGGTAAQQVAAATPAPAPEAAAISTGAVVDLRPSVRPSPLRDPSRGTVLIAGRARLEDGAPIQIRVTTSLGRTYLAQATVHGHRFQCRFPQQFRGAPRLAPMLMYVDATDGQFGQDMALHQAEALLVVGTRSRLPDLPLAFTDDCIDAGGRKDRAAAQWPRLRTLVNLFMHSRAAAMMRIGRSDFDLDRDSDFTWFKNSASLYDFDHRDSDWSTPLGHRVARGFWQAVWNTWFNPSNDHPWDGDRTNLAPGNYRPYTFANDPSDILVLYQMLRAARPVVADNRAALTAEVQENLLAMQQRSADNFALPDAAGRREHYTAGAFHYGLFETGEWLTEGKGWFVNPQFRDYASGGVLNGRCVWALGAGIRANLRYPRRGAAPTVPTARLNQALQLALKFCLSDGLAHGYTYRTPHGRTVWSAIPGEHAYLLLGMLAACEVEPQLPVTVGGQVTSLKSACADALDALVEIARPDGTWSDYANADANNIMALAEGARALAPQPQSADWRAAAARAADVWLNLPPTEGEKIAPTPLVGHRKNGGFTFVQTAGETAHRPLYIGGLWLHALAALYDVTRQPRYAQRAEAILGYYCGDNPPGVRLLDELGTVNNRVTDRDGDGVEETLDWDAYPESMAFVQIGLLRLLQAGPPLHPF